MKTYAATIMTGMKSLRYDYVAETRSWRIWASHSACRRFGTYVELYPDGKIEMTTLRSGRPEDTVLLT